MAAAERRTTPRDEGTGPSPWRSRIAGTADVPPGDLAANPANWRTHPRLQREALAGSLDGVGWVRHVVANRTTGRLVDGHARVELALSRGEPTVPVLYVDLSPEEERLVLATLDPIGALAGADAASLGSLLAEVSSGDAGLAALLDSLRAGLPAAGQAGPDDAPALPAEPYVARGDLWLLGRHRLLCGDATDAVDVERLLGGERPALTVTDPPYGVEYDPAARAGARRRGAVPNDDRADWREAWALCPSDVLYAWHSGLHAGVVADGLGAAGFEVRAQIVWAKPSPVLGRGAYHWQHEPAYYAVRRGARPAWIGGRGQGTVWEAPPVRSGAGADAPTPHGTQKPVELMARPMRNHAGDVYDPFAGSGTTLVAAEQLGRRAYAMELDPRYAQVALERWQAYAGQRAGRA